MFFFIIVLVQRLHQSVQFTAVMTRFVQNVLCSTELVNFAVLDDNDVVAVLAGIVVASVWNFALSSKFVWGKY